MRPRALCIVFFVVVEKSVMCYLVYLMNK